MNRHRVYSVDYDRYFESDFGFPSASTKRYVLKKYSPKIPNNLEYDSSNYSFRPITPTYSTQQIHNRPTNVYYDERNQINLPTKNKQTQYVPYFQRNIQSSSSPISEFDIDMDRFGGNRKASDDLEIQLQPKKTNRRGLVKRLFDILAIALTCIIFGLIYALSKPAPRGFFCDDTSIRYPIKPDTIPMWLLGVYGGIGPVLIFIIVEIWVVRPFSCGHSGNPENLKQRRIDYIKAIVQTIFLFGLGIAVCFLITEVGKRTIGRLRPYYLTLCNPDWSKISCVSTVPSVTGPLTVPLYVTNHFCDPSVPAKDLQEARLSFPSGHSSYSTFAFVFLFVYFEARLVCPKVQFLKPFLQCLCIAIAFYTCLSRVIDFKHHPTDVLGGAIIGFCIAIFAAVRVGTYLWKFGVYCETENQTKKDRLPPDERVPMPGIDKRQNGTLAGTDQMQIESIHNPRQSNVSHFRSQDRSHNNPTKTNNGGRRVSPITGYDGSNA